MSVIGGILGFIHTTGDDGLPWLMNGSMGLKSESGENITPDTCLGLSAYFACIRNISEDIGKLPLHIYKRLPNDAKEKATEHRLYNMLHTAPNPIMSSMSLRETLTGHAMGWGGGFAEIEQDGAGRPLYLHPIHPSRIGIKREPDKLIYIVKAAVQGAEGVIIPQERVFHLHGFGPDGISGYSIAALSKEAVGLGLTAQKFGARFLRQGIRASGVYKHPGVLGDDAMKHLRESFKDMYAGPENVGSPIILEEGMDWTQTTIPPEEAQYLETRYLQVEELARWFRMSPHKIQHLLRATFSNITHQAMEYVVDCLMAWAVRWEQEIARKLLAGEPDYFAEFLFTALLRGDPTERAEFYFKRFQTGMSINEIRRLENENPIGPAGDVHFVMSNMVPVESLLEQPEPEPEPPAFPPEPEPEPEETVASVRLAMIPVFEDAMARVRSKVTKATERAVKKYNADPASFAAWADTFFATHKDYVAEALIPAALSYAGLLGKNGADIEAAIRQYAGFHAQNEHTTVMLVYEMPIRIDLWAGGRGKHQQVESCALMAMQSVEDAINGRVYANARTDA